MKVCSLVPMRERGRFATPLMLALDLFPGWIGVDTMMNFAGSSLLRLSSAHRHLWCVRPQLGHVRGLQAYGNSRSMYSSYEARGI
jgi:hypothetical protein